MRDDNFIMLPTVDVCFKGLMYNPKVRKGFIAALLGTDPVEGVSMIADASAKAAHLRTMSTLVVPCVVASLEA